MANNIVKLSVKEVAEELARKIADNTIEKCGLKKYSAMHIWLFNKLKNLSVLQLTNIDIKVYIFDLAKKCYADLLYIQSIEVANNTTMRKNYPEVFAFIESVATEKGGSVDTMFSVGNEYWDNGAFVENGEFFACGSKYDFVVVPTDEVKTNFEKIGDCTIFNYSERGVGCYYDSHADVHRPIPDGEVVKCEKDFPSRYCVSLIIRNHPNYNEDDLVERVVKRMHHKRGKEISIIDASSFFDSAEQVYNIFVEFTDVLANIEDVKKMLAYRLGRTSAKPWYRCEIENVNQVDNGIVN